MILCVLLITNNREVPVLIIGSIGIPACDPLINRQDAVLPMREWLTGKMLPRLERREKWLIILEDLLKIPCLLKR